VNAVSSLRWLLTVPCFLSSVVAGTAVGQTLWEGNGHYYLIVEQETTWQQARSLAESMVFMGVQGHLATITSEAENTFVSTQLGDTAGAWLGGQQPPGSSEPEGGWRWITGEPWVYTNWDKGEPNNTYFGGWGKEETGQSEERLQYHHNGTHWNDLPDDPEVITPRFIVEWDVSTESCVPPAGLTGWWPGDGSTEDLVGGRNAVLRDDATFGPGLVDQAYRLDGDGDFVDVPHDPDLNVGTGDFTVDLWVNFNTTAGEQILVEKWIQRLDSDLSRGWTFTKLDGDVLHMALFSGDGLGELVFSEVLTIPTGTWHHFAARRQRGEITLFMNGAPVASGVFSGNLDSTSSLKFGHRGSPSDTPGSDDERGFFLNGRIDEVEVFVRRALSNAEIQAIFNAGSAGKCKDTEVVEVTIDIKPGSFPNSINPKSNGVIPVAILSTKTFDATTVDPLTVRFGPKGAKEAHNKGHIEDVNHDGEPDLVLHFKTQATGIRCGDTSAALTGETFDRNPIQGSDAIKTVGCKK
jgi:Concanavalin A-like lectin/glucanases superfamily/Lectin C-type domain